MKYNITYPIVAIISLSIIGLVFSLLFGSMGFKIFCGFIIFYGLSILFIFNQLPLDPDEKFFFGFFISFAIFPILIWYVDRLFHSFRLSIIISLILIILVGIILKIKRGKKNDGTDK